MLETKAIEDVEAADLLELVAQQVSERRSIDYKLQPWRLFATDAKDQRAQRVEFLRDVSSFANSAGGHLVVGIKDSDGKPSELLGFDAARQEDKWKGCMQELIHRWIKPRVDVDMHFIPLRDSNSALIIRIPPSAIGPHQVALGENGTFHARDSKGKHEMDVDELRIAFGASAQIAKQIREFHRERVRLVVSPDAPVLLADGPRLVVNMIPQECFTTRRQFRLTELKDAMKDALPIGGSPIATNDKINLDGPFKAVGEPTRTYLQLFRNGIIEAANADIVVGLPNEPLLYSSLNERYLLDALPEYLRVLKNLGLRPPIALFVTLCNMKSVAIRKDFQQHFFDRNTIAAPEIVLESLDEDIPAVVRSAADVIWNSAGLLRCEVFDQAGKWIPQQHLS